MSLLEPNPKAPQAWYGSLPVTSRFTYGIAGERFFRALKDEGILLGSTCPRCKITYVPAVAFCERCLAGLEEFVDVGTRGEVLTFTVLHVNADGSPKEPAEIIAFIKIADGGLVHKLGEVTPQEVYIGMPVKLVLKPARQREGSISDIMYFKPISSEAS